MNLREDLPGSEDAWPEGYDPNNRRRKLESSYSGKMAVLDRLVKFLPTFEPQMNAEL